MSKRRAECTRLNTRAVLRDTVELMPPGADGDPGARLVSETSQSPSFPRAAHFKCRERAATPLINMNYTGL